jgi:DNA-binding NarL/FixJ family response regulator
MLLIQTLAKRCLVSSSIFAAVELFGEGATFHSNMTEIEERVWGKMVAVTEPVTLNMNDEEVLTKLTEREREILRLIFDGKCSNEVAIVLCVSKRTVDFHLARAYVKLGVSNRFQAFKRALQLGIINS